MDHQPSFAAQVQAKETEIGRKLEPEELRKLKSATPAIVFLAKNHPAEILG